MEDTDRQKSLSETLNGFINKCGGVDDFADC